MNRPPAHSRCGLVRLLLAIVACTLFATPALAAPGSRSTDGVWRELAPDAIQSGVLAYDFASPDDYRLLQLDDLALFRILREAPDEFTPASRTSNAILALPMPDGTFARFRVSRSPVLSPKLSAEHPEIMSYVAQGVDNPTHTASFARSPLGFNAMIVTPTDYIVIERVEAGAPDMYLSFRRSDLPTPDGFTCSSDEEAQAVLGKPVLAPPSGANLRTYNLAMVATAEFRNAHASQAAVVQRFNNYITAVNAIYGVEVAIRFTITCTSTGYTNAGTDPFTNPESVDGTLLDEADATLDTDCGAYQIGHLLHLRAGGGNSFSGRAAFASVCQGDAGRAASTVTNVASALWTTDVLPHEMGHQFSAQHTYNSTAGGCVERVAGSAYEIGNGTTLMSYACAGCTAAEDPNAGCADGYFHTHSFEQITDYREAGGNCGAQTGTGNTAPTVGAGPDVTIPRGTPFALTATGSDPDGDAVTWCWEQHDLGAASPPLGGNGPLFRSLPATASPTRTFPNLTSLLAGTATPFEILPTTDRTLTFRATARDNRAGGGGVNYDTIVLTVAGDPFFVTSPNGGESLKGGCSVDVTWTVGGGDVAANVNIYVSTDGGLTWPNLVAGNVANDGSQSVVLPCVATTQSDARVKVEAVGNVFFDVSNGNFTIATAAPVASVTAPTEVNIGPACSVIIPVSGSVIDDCTMQAGDVTITAVSLGGTATVVSAINKVQNGANRVDFSGTVTVSDLSSCPSIVRITAVGTDGCGLADDAIADVTVLDPTPPVVVTDATGGEVGPTCTYLLPFTAVLTDNCAIDPSDVIVNVTNPSNNATVDIPQWVTAQPLPGRLEVTGTVLVSDLTSCPAVIRVDVGIADQCGNASNDTIDVEVVDVTPPEIAVVLNREFLWPPNHKLVDIVAEVTVTDNCPKPSFVLTSITSNEPENDLGDGNTAPDIVGATVGTPDLAFQLRSERMGPRTGRVYTITYTASDNCGNTDVAQVLVRVEHDQSGHAVVVAVSGAGSGFGDDYLAVVVPAALPSTADDEELLSPVDRSANLPRRAASPQDLLIGNTADVLEASRLVHADVDGDGLRDAIALFSLGKVEAIRAQSTELDGPIGLHYGNELGESFLVADLFASPQAELGSTLGAIVLTALDGALVTAPTAVASAPTAKVEAAAAPTAIAAAGMPATTKLAGFRPNPFVSRTAVSFELARASRVTVDVFGPDGKRVRALADLAYDPGRHTMTWDGRDDAGVRVSAGVYFVRFAADGVIETGKALLLP